MTRLEALKEFESHPMHSRDFKRLSAKELAAVVEFIKENDHLDRNSFAEKANRWMLDEVRPKHYSIMWALAFQVNTRSSCR